MKEATEFYNDGIVSRNHLAHLFQASRNAIRPSAFAPCALLALTMSLCALLILVPVGQLTGLAQTNTVTKNNTYVLEDLAVMNHRSELVSKIKRYRIEDRDPYWKDIRLLAERQTLSEQTCRGLLFQLELLVQDQEDFPNLLHRIPDEDELYADGKPDIEIGHLVENTRLRFGLRLRDRPRNVIVAGAAGSGKTVTLRNICFKVHAYNQRHPEKRITVIVLDPKQDFTDLREKLGPDWLHFSVHDNLRIGLNGPVGVSPTIWINNISTCLAARLGLVISRTCLASIIHWALPVLNPAPHGNDLIWPSLKLILEIAENAPLSCFSSKADYGKTLTQLLQGLIMDSGELFNCSNGFLINRDLIQAKRNCVIDISNLPDYLRPYLSDCLISQELVRRLHKGQKLDRTDTMYVNDEGDLLTCLESEQVFADQMSPLSHMASLGRELGMQSTLGVSNIQKVAPHLLSSACYTLVFNVSDTDSVIAARRALLLEAGAELMLTALKPGQCLFRESQGAWPRTMWGQVDYISPAR
jgi:hypothetical protein